MPITCKSPSSLPSLRRTTTTIPFTFPLRFTSLLNDDRLLLLILGQKSLSHCSPPLAQLCSIPTFRPLSKFYTLLSIYVVYFLLVRSSTRSFIHSFIHSSTHSSASDCATLITSPPRIHTPVTNDDALPQSASILVATSGDTSSTCVILTLVLYANWLSRVTLSSPYVQYFSTYYVSPYATTQIVNHCQSFHQRPCLSITNQTVICPIIKVYTANYILPIYLPPTFIVPIVPPRFLSISFTLSARFSHPPPPRLLPSRVLAAARGCTPMFLFLHNSLSSITLTEQSKTHATPLILPYFHHPQSSSYFLQSSVSFLQRLSANIPPSSHHPRRRVQLWRRTLCLHAFQLSREKKARPAQKQPVVYRIHYFNNRTPWLPILVEPFS